LADDRILDGHHGIGEVEGLARIAAELVERVAPREAHFALEPITKRPPVGHAQAVVIGDAGVQQLHHAAKAWVGLISWQTAEPIGEIRGIVVRIE